MIWKTVHIGITWLAELIGLHGEHDKNSAPERRQRISYFEVTLVNGSGRCMQNVRCSKNYGYIAIISSIHLYNLAICTKTWIRR
jgi:hypothetical protein